MVQDKTPDGKKPIVQGTTSHNRPNLRRGRSSVRCRCPPLVQKRNQQNATVDRQKYRYVWNNKKEPPLITMEETHTNMQDIRNQLNIKTLQWKIEKRSLQRMSCSQNEKLETGQSGCPQLVTCSRNNP